MAAWKATYKAAESKDSALMEQFFALYKPESSSIWTLTYDEPESNESLEDTVEIIKSFMKNTESIQDHCFGVMHVVDGLGIEGVS